MRKAVVLNHAIRLVSALALLVSVMTSPIRPHGASRISHPNHLRRNFGVPGKAPTGHRPHIPAAARVTQVKAVSSESKPDCHAYPSFDGVDPHYLADAPAEFRPLSVAVHLDRMSHMPRC